MTQLAHDCVMLEIPVDTGRLFSGGDPGYELWLLGLVERVSDTRRQQAERERRAAKG